MTTVAKYTAQEIAQWFINRAESDVSLGGDYITPLKLQKLIYYAQGSYLALKGRALFDDKIVKWRYGPVVVNVYNKYRDLKDNIINEYKEVNIDRDTVKILEDVYEIFGQFSALKLMQMTHEESPWINAKDNQEITQLSIKKYFLKNYVEA